jgi:hypothetical protein
VGLECFVILALVVFRTREFVANLEIWQSLCLLIIADIPSMVKGTEYRI